MSKLGSKLRIAGVIPARLNSTRLSRKVLREIAGLPMVEWVWRAAYDSGLMDPVVVATDSDEVAEVCQHRGIPVVMTSASCASGSDRVREVARLVDTDIYVNIQGDEPTLTPEFFPPLLELFERPEVQVATLAVRCPAEDIDNPNAVKVVTALDGRRRSIFREPRFRLIAIVSGTMRGSPDTGSIWESMRIERPRWCGLPSCRPRGLNDWNGWSNYACSIMELTSTWRRLRETRLAWIRKRIW